MQPGRRRSRAIFAKTYKTYRMKTFKHLVILASLATLAAQAPAQTATWNNQAADNNWNTAGNWDLGVPAEGTNALVNTGGTVNYNNPMAATSFGALTNLGSTINVNAAGFVIGGSGNQAAFNASSTATKFYVNSGGVVSIPAGGMTFTTNGAGALAAGASMTLNGTLIVGIGGSSGGGGGAGFFTNLGGALVTGGLTINGSSGNPQSCVCYILGGTNQFGGVSVGRSAAGSGGFSTFGQEGLIISNGIVTMTGLDVGAGSGNSFLTMFLGNGTVTNSGTMTVRQGSGSRSSRFLHNGGIFQSGSVNLRGHTNNNSIVIYSVAGGTNLVDGFVLGNPNGLDTTGTIRLTNASKLYIGASGITSVGTLNTRTIALNTGGSLGAQADWSGTEPILLAGGSFDAGELSGTAHNISLSGVLSGTGVLTKNGGGILTLNAANTYSGNTTINQGTLALGASGSIANTPQITVAAGATFDVTAAGYTLASSRTLTGLGTVNGAFAVAGGGTINPGPSAGALTFGSSLTMTGAAVLHFDLPTTPGPGNDLLVVNGDLNATNANTLEIVGGGSPGTVHRLIQYGGNFNGALASFTLSGATGILSNNPTAKTISLVVQAAIRNPTNVVWVGNATVNDWDTVDRTNWLNSGTGLIDYFVTGDNALFSDTGAAHPNINLVGNNAPATVTVGAAANYTLGGSGAISGAANLVKTNTGTLVINSTNTYTGITTLAGGVTEVTLLAAGGFPSALGAASAASANLVVDGATLRYTGASVSTDRGATFDTNGATMDVTNAATALTVSGTLTGAGALTKLGQGNLTLTVANSYAGGTVISNGTLQLNIAGAAGSGGITNTGAILDVNGAIAADNILAFNADSQIQLSGVGSGNVALRGAWIGTNTVTANFVTQNTSQTLSIGGEGAGGGTMNDFAGTLNLGTNRGYCRLNNNATINLGSPNAIFNLGTGDVTFYQRNGGTITQLGALEGGPDTRLSGARNDVTGTTTYSIGALNLDTVFAGMITNGQSSSSIRPAAIIKVGTGKLTLTGLSPYTGATSVEAGTLQVDGSITASAITVSGGTLAGNGTLGGPVDVQAGGTLSPGDGIGLLTINNTLTLEPGSTAIMELDKAAGTNDSVAGLTSVSYAGTLIVTNLAGTLAQGDTFHLFPSAGSYAGGFDTVSLPALPSGLVWNTNNLTVDGSIAVGTPSGPPLNYTLSGTSIQFSWSGPYKLQSQTNNTHVGLSTNWYDYPGGGSSPVTVPMDAGAGAVFFRLATP
jgi:autotransporter-associated beta strand protein